MVSKCILYPTRYYWKKKSISWFEKTEKWLEISKPNFYHLCCLEMSTSKKLWKLWVLKIWFHKSSNGRGRLIFQATPQTLVRNLIWNSCKTAKTLVMISQVVSWFDKGSLKCPVHFLRCPWITFISYKGASTKDIRFLGR